MPLHQVGVDSPLKNTTTNRYSNPLLRFLEFLRSLKARQELMATRTMIPTLRCTAGWTLAIFLRGGIRRLRESGKVEPGEPRKKMMTKRSMPTLWCTAGWTLADFSRPRFRKNEKGASSETRKARGRVRSVRKWAQIRRKRLLPQNGRKSSEQKNPKPNLEQETP